MFKLSLGRVKADTQTEAEHRETDQLVTSMSHVKRQRKGHITEKEDHTECESGFTAPILCSFLLSWTLKEQTHPQINEGKNFLHGT